jgi:hypothetical protein
MELCRFDWATNQLAYFLKVFSLYLAENSVAVRMARFLLGESR